MPVAYDVEARLAVIDRASPALRRVMELADRLAKSLERVRRASRGIFSDTNAGAFNRQLARMGAPLDRAAAAMDRMAAAGNTAFAKLNASIDAATARVAALRDELGGAAATAREIRLGRIAVTPPRRAAVSVVAGAKAAETARARPGAPALPQFLLGAGSHGGEMGRAAPRYLGYGLLGAAMFGAYQQARALNYVNAALLAARKPFLGPDFKLSPQARALNAAIQKISTQTGVPIATAGGEVRLAMRQLQTIPFKERVGLLPELGRFAFIEHFVTGAEPISAVESLIGLAHQWNAYTAPKMKRLMAGLAGVSIATSATLPQIMQTSGYVSGTAQALHIPRNEILDLIATAQLAGIKSTRAGTWLNALLLEGLNPKGGLAALLSSKAGRRRYAAMEKLGLVEHGRMVGLDRLMSGDVVGFARNLQTHLARAPRDQIGALAYQAFGSIRATRFALLQDLSQFVTAYQAVEKVRKTVLAGGTQTVLAKLSQATPSLQFHQTAQKFTTALMLLGTKVLPPLTSVLQSLDKTLSALIPALPGAKGGKLKPGDVGRTGAVVGGAIGYAVGGAPGAAIGGALGYGLGYGSEARIRAAAAQMKKGYLTQTGPGGIPFVVTAPDKTAMHAAMVSGGWGSFGAWIKHELGFAKPPAATTPPQVTQTINAPSHVSITVNVQGNATPADIQKGVSQALAEQTKKLGETLRQSNRTSFGDTRFPIPAGYGGGF